MRSFRLPRDAERFPVDAIVDDILAVLAASEIVVVVAPPGAGKTSRVPTALLDEPWCTGQVILTQPRRLAARMAAERLAESLGEQVGQTVGLRTGEATKVSARTRLVVCTEGVLVRMVRNDAELIGVSAVLLDEVHERSLDMDLAVALLRSVREIVRPDLRLGLLSATLDDERIGAALGAVVVRSVGRAFPISQSWEPVIIAEFARSTAMIVARESEAMDYGSALLVFAPGRGEIEAVRRALRRYYPALVSGATEVLALHGSSTHDDVGLALGPVDPAVKRIVLATNIAQTSITLPGVKVVIDLGLEKRSVIDGSSGLPRLATERISQATATQRAGRAGRLGPGRAIALWSAAEHRTLNSFDVPEIMRSDLTDLVLASLHWGARAPMALPWLDPPSDETWNDATRTLTALDAIDPSLILTPMGLALADLPITARLGRVLLKAHALEEHHRLAAVALVALLASDRRASGNESIASQVQSLAETLRQRLRAPNRSRPANDVERLAQRLEQINPAIDVSSSVDFDHVDPLSLGALVSLALPERIAGRSLTNAGRYVLASGLDAEMGADDPNRGLELVVATEIDATRHRGRIFSSLPIRPDEIEQLHGDRLRRERVVELTRGPLDGTVVVTENVLLGAVRIRSTRLDPTPSEIAEAVLSSLSIDTVRAWLADSAIAEISGRVAFLRARSADDAWPDLSPEGLVTTTETWLSPLLIGAQPSRPLRASSPSDLLALVLPYAKRMEMERRAPATVALPSGRMVTVDYSTEAGPTVRAKLQEFFGAAAGPVADGTSCRLELLTPAGRAAAVTNDLSRFWAVGYPSVRAELRGRYPKHDWPVDPRNALPQSGVKRPHSKHA